MKISVPFKIVAGYALVTTALVFSVWLAYDNTREFARMNRVERVLVERRDLADSMVYCLLEMSTVERSIFLGDATEWDRFDSLTTRVMELADTLAARTGGGLTVERTDSLRSLLIMRRYNAINVMSEMSADGSEKLLREKVENLRSSRDSMMIRPKTVAVKEDKEVVYDVVRTKKGFFRRLGDAFKKQRSDTVAVTSTTRKEVSDSTVQAIDIADSLATVLERIEVEETRLREARVKELGMKGRQQRVTGLRLAREVDKILDEIRDDEHRSLRETLDADLSARRGVARRIMLLAGVAVMLVLILLYHVLRDIRRARLYNESLRLANAETERVMNQRERLLLTITHDIKAPAASICGFVELLGDYVGGGKAASYLANVKSSANHLLDLVAALLDYHKLESGKVEIRKVSFSPRMIVEGCVERARPMAESKGLTLAADASDCGERLCRGDAFKINQILDNLVGNAVKYTDEGEVRVTAVVRNSYLMVDVADTGRGMTPEETRTAFNAFTRLSGSSGVEGVGLGLSITKEMVTLLDGRVTVASEKGRGTTFSVSLPVEMSDEKEPSAEAPDSSATTTDAPMDSERRAVAAPLRRLRLLIVDDDRLQLRLLGEMLERVSGGAWDIKAVDNASEATRELSLSKPDVLIADVEMPDMGGLEIASGIADKGDMALIAMTAHEPSIAPRLLEAGFDACLFKPFSVDKLRATLSEVTGEELIVGEPTTECSHAGRLDALIAYAAGDKEAAREILSSFSADLSSHAERLEKAVAELDREAVSAVAHKALPLLEMTRSTVTGRLRALSPGSVEELSDELLAQYCSEIVVDMRAIRAEIASTDI